MNSQKSIATTADNLNFDSIYAYDHLIPHYKDDIEKNRFSFSACEYDWRPCILLV